jgi:hypothetical protein
MNLYKRIAQIISGSELTDEEVVFILGRLEYMHIMGKVVDIKQDVITKLGMLTNMLENLIQISKFDVSEVNESDDNKNIESVDVFDIIQEYHPEGEERINELRKNKSKKNNKKK